MLFTSAVRLLLVASLLLLVSLPEFDCKRSRGRSRGNSGGTHYGRSKPKLPTQQHDPVSLSYPNAPKPQSVPSPQSPPKPPPQPTPVKTHESPRPSAPVQETAVKQQASSVQSAPSAPKTNERPIGWNVDQQAGAKEATAAKSNVGWNVGSSNTPQHNAAPPPYTPHGNPQYSAPLGSQTHPQGPPPPYSQYPGGGSSVGGHPYGPPPPYSQHPGSYPNQPQYGGAGGYHPPGYPGGYPQQNGYYPGYGGHGGYGGGGYGPPGYGGGFGGGFGGFGGFGGGGSPFGYGTGYPKSSGGFFGKHPFRNILAGLLIWNVVRGFTSTPYHVYHYYHRPEALPENIPVAANTIVLCDENATSICAPNTVALCTSNSTIMCVVTVASTTPCGGNTTVACVNATVPCIDEKDPACINNTAGQNFTTVSMPCLANVTVQGKLEIPESAKENASYASTLELFNTAARDKRGAVFCLTTLATPEPELANSTMPPVPCYGSDGKEVSSNGTKPCVNGVMPLMTPAPVLDGKALPEIFNITQTASVENEVNVSVTEAAVTSSTASVKNDTDVSTVQAAVTSPAA